MQQYNKQLRNLIKKSKNILVITHRSPDVDAFCSLILAKQFILQLDPKKKVVMKTRQMPGINLPGMKEISITNEIARGDEDLLILTDSAQLGMCLDNPEDSLKWKDLPIICIDHHSGVDPEANALIINESRSSATEQVFASFKDILGRGFKITKDIAELTQYGISSDTGRFLYSITTPDSLRIYADAMAVSRADMEDFSYKIAKFPRAANAAMMGYMNNLTIVKDMAYMYITKKEVEEKGLDKTGVNEAQNFLRDRYIKYIQGVHWGFILKPDFDHENTWYVSFRGIKGYQDVSIIAQKLGGGGHPYASASPIKAANDEEALKTVLDAIDEVLKAQV